MTDAVDMLGGERAPGMDGMASPSSGWRMVLTDELACRLSTLSQKGMTTVPAAAQLRAVMWRMKGNGATNFYTGCWTQVRAMKLY